MATFAGMGRIANQLTAVPRQNALVGCFDVAEFERVVVDEFFGLIKSAGLGIMSGYEKGVSTSAEYIQKLHEVTEKICKAKIESFT